MKLLVYSAFYGSPSYTSLACENHLFYCLKNGYDYLPLHGLCSKRTPNWQKVLAGIDILKSSKYDAIFWMDGDSFFMNPDFKLESFLDQYPSSSFIFSRCREDVINSGHFLAANTLDAIRLMEGWRDLYGRCDGIVTTNKKAGFISDNPSICTLLGGGNPYDSNTWESAFNNINIWEGNPNKKISESEYSPRSQDSADFAQSLISQRWRPFCRALPETAMNTSPCDYCDGDFIIHFAGGSRGLLPEFVPKIPTIALPPPIEESAAMLGKKLVLKAIKRLGFSALRNRGPR